MGRQRILYYDDLYYMNEMSCLDLNMMMNLQQRFRDAVTKTKGMKKINLTVSLEETLDGRISNRVI